MTTETAERVIPRPLGDKVILEPIEISDVLPSGLIRPTSASDRIKRARVVAVGRGYRHPVTMEVIPLECRVGDVVAYSHGTVEIEVQCRKYLVCSEGVILAVIPGGDGE